MTKILSKPGKQNGASSVRSVCMVAWGSGVR